jgi:8-oxo-dGTP pyrophosphatase MutT (NUDIX family)
VKLPTRARSTHTLQLVGGIAIGLWQMILTVLEAVIVSHADRLAVRSGVPSSYAAIMAEECGGWRTFGEKTVYDNRWVRLGIVDVQAPNGERWEYHVVHLDRIAVALIVDDQDRVLMSWRYRFVTEQWGYELLGGMVDAEEDAAVAAARETEEESGWRPMGEPERLVSFEPLPGQVTAPVDVFLWREAVRIGEPTDTEEVGRVEWVPLSRVPKLAHRQQLLGSGTLVALLYYLASRGNAAAAG